MRLKLDDISDKVLEAIALRSLWNKCHKKLIHVPKCHIMEVCGGHILNIWRPPLESVGVHMESLILWWSMSGHACVRQSVHLGIIPNTKWGCMSQPQN